jgi:hypothetical protein
MRAIASLANRHPVWTLTLLGCALMLPALLWGPGATHSHLYNHMWTHHFGEQMAAGHLYERWLPRSFEGLGSPTFYFYPPLAYWLSGGLNAIGLNVGQAITGASLLLMIASGLAMYAFLAARGTRPLVGAALYMAAPYHLFDIHVRGALAEFAGFVWLPLIALGIHCLPTRRGIALLASAYAALILTHLPLATLTGLFLIAPLMVQRIMQDRATLLPGLAAGLLAFALAAFYLLPAATLQSHMSTALLWTGKYQASGWSIWREDVELFPCVALGLGLLAWRARSLWTAITVGTALAAVNLIPLLWNIDLLDKVQFPWRILAITEFAAVTAMAACPPRHIIAIGAGVVLAFPLLLTSLIASAVLKMPVDYARIERHQPDAPEYLPAGFDAALVDRVDRWTDLTRFRALPRGDSIAIIRPSPVTIGHAAFPIWQVTRDGKAVPSHGPLISFDATPGTYRIERVRLWQENVGAAISLFALLLAVLTGRRAISHLSKFPAYSPSQALSDRPSFGRLRSRITGGEL